MAQQPPPLLPPACLAWRPACAGALPAAPLQTLANCGDAIRLEAQPPKEGDIGTVLDNTIWFDTITNSRNGEWVEAAARSGGTPPLPGPTPCLWRWRSGTRPALPLARFDGRPCLGAWCCAGIAYRAGEGCGGDACIFQGNQVLGSAITGCAASGQTAAMAFFFSAKPMPAWDSNQFNIATVTPCKTNTAYALLYADPRTETAREVVRCAARARRRGQQSEQPVERADGWARWLAAAAHHLQ